MSDCVLRSNTKRLLSYFRRQSSVVVMLLLAAEGVYVSVCLRVILIASTCVYVSV